jgi:hypothetical protein
VPLKSHEKMQEYAKQYTTLSRGQVASIHLHSASLGQLVLALSYKLLANKEKYPSEYAAIYAAISPLVIDIQDTVTKSLSEEYKTSASIRKYLTFLTSSPSPKKSSRKPPMTLAASNITDVVHAMHQFIVAIRDIFILDCASKVAGSDNVFAYYDSIIETYGVSIGPEDLPIIRDIVSHIASWDVVISGFIIGYDKHYAPIIPADFGVDRHDIAPSTVARPKDTTAARTGGTKMADIKSRELAAPISRAPSAMAPAMAMLTHDAGGLFIPAAGAGISASKRS